MNRKTLVGELVSAGCVLVRHGAKHDLYLNPHNGVKQTIPRHNEIDEVLARHILSRLLR